MAEALGERKNSGKSLKAKGLSKKDKYLFKRRDEPNEKRAAMQDSYHAGQLRANAVPSLSIKEASGNFPPGDYVLQKRAPAVQGKYSISTKQEERKVRAEFGALAIKLDSVDSQGSAILPTVSVDPMSRPPAYGHDRSVQGGSEEGKLPTESLANEMDESPELTGRMKLDETVRSTSTATDLGKPKSLGTVDGISKIAGREMDAMLVEQSREQDQVIGDGNVGRSSVSVDDSLSGKAPGTPTGDVVVGKVKKSLKRPIRDVLGQEKYVMGEQKKKKKKDIGYEMSLEHQRKHPKIVKDGEARKLAGKSIGIGLDSREHSLIGSERKGGIRSDFAVVSSRADAASAEVELPQLVDDLLALALDPFHAIERSSPAVVRHVFLKFRSLVYQKSLVLPSSGETERSEPGPVKSGGGRALLEPSIVNAEVSLTVEGKEAPDLKSLKHSSKLDDPSKAGRKRGPSDRQEEMSAKRLKKLKNLKLLALEKKAGGQNNTLDGPKKVGQKETGAVALMQPSKKDPVKKKELPARVTKPTALLMKFPPKTTLPSAPELKARFARFGPLDLSGMRVYWKSSTCRVVFKYKSDAQAAYNHAIRNNPLFGQVKARYNLRELDLPASELLETDKQHVDNGADDAPASRPNNSDFVGEVRPSVKQQQQSSSVQLKSCLKKPSGDEAGPAAVITKESPRVKFVLGGDDSRGEQTVISSSNDGSSADGAPSSSMAFDVNIKNIKSMGIPQLPLPLPFPSRNPDMPLLSPQPRPSLQPSRTPDMLPTPPSIVPRPPFSHAPELHESRGHFGKAAHQALYSEGDERNESHVDISYQLLSLLMRCSDIVTDVKSTLGYVPYHPL